MMTYAQGDDHAAAILSRRAGGLLALDDALAELSDADCVAAIATLIAERIALRADVVSQALDAPADETISVMCRAAGFRINSYSALLRMRRRRNRGTDNPPAYNALTLFSDLSPASAERLLRRMTAEPAAGHTCPKPDRGDVNRGIRPDGGAGHKPLY